MKVKSPADWDLERGALLDVLREFAQIYERRPFNNRQGLRGVSAFALYWFVRRIAPDIVFEVGIWKGFSTWLIEQAAPQADVHSFDPIVMLREYLKRWKVGRTYRSPRAHYSAQDFSCAPIAQLAANRRALAFFDDHQNKMPRLLQCKAAGIKDIVFDDNLAQPYTHRTLEHERAADASVLEREIASYEVFPALWPVHLDIAGLKIDEPGMGFPVKREFRDLYRDRDWHSYVTYVRLN